MNLRAIHPIHCTGTAISHISVSLCEYMQVPGLGVSLLVPAAEPSAMRPFVHQAIPWFLKAAVYHYYKSEAKVADLTARKFVKSLKRDDVVYIWPGSPLWLYRAVKDRGNLLVMERINCHRATAKRLLDEAYRHAGLAPTHGLTQEDTDCETTKLGLADFVFSPAPNVERSLLELGLPPGKILAASYGWDPTRLKTAPVNRDSDDGLVALFLGRICIRKGANLLLEAWANAGVRGQLILAGRLDDEIASVSRDHLARPDVVVLPFVKDIAPVFASADLFAFPTHEEGSPLVVYEALGAGVPVLTTPMGAGDVIRDGVEGLVRPAYDTDAWVTTLRELAQNRDRLKPMGEQARARGNQFTWERAGRRRAAILQKAMGAEPGLRAGVTAGDS